MNSIENDVDKSWEDCNDYLSKSRLSIYKFCPLQFKKIYVDNEPRSPPNHSMIVGTRFHNWAELFGLHAHKIPVDQWESTIHDEFYPDEKDAIQWYINQERDRLQLLNNNLDLWKPLECEYKILDHINKRRGIIDQIHALGKNTICVIEYKTGKSIYVPGLAFEFGFYKMLLKSDPLYKDKDMIFCVINPRIKQLEFISPSRESTIIKVIDRLNYSLDTGVFPTECTGVKFSVCRRCTTDECGLYNFDN